MADKGVTSGALRGRVGDDSAGSSAAETGDKRPSNDHSKPEKSTSRLGVPRSEARRIRTRAVSRQDYADSLSLGLEASDARGDVTPSSLPSQENANESIKLRSDIVGLMMMLISLETPAQTLNRS